MAQQAPAHAADAAGRPITKRRAWRALFALCVGLFLTLMDQSLVAVSLPRIAEDLGGDLNQTIWVSAVYLLTFAVPLLVTGRLGDHFGQRTVYLVGMIVFVLAALACALAPSMEWLIVFRALQGFGGALINPQPLAIINRVFPYHRRGAAMGVWSAVAGSAGLFGPVLGGLLVGYAEWRWVFAVYVPLGVVSLITVALWVPRLPAARDSRIDLGSALYSLLAVLGVVFALQQGPELGWNVWIWGSLVAGLAVLALFLRRQRALGDRALMPLRLYRNRNFGNGVLAVFTLGFAVYPVQLPIMLYLQVQLDLPAEQAALALIPMGLVSIIFAPLAGRLTDRMKPGVLSRAGFGALITAMALFAFMFSRGLSLWWVLLPVVLLGLANALVWSPNSTITLRAVPTELAGAGSGVYNTSRQVGAVLGAAASGAVMQMFQPLGIGVATGVAMLVPVAGLVIGLLAVGNFTSDHDHEKP
ncbi:DHA2 family efflux MFS transporter permease subunit [Corynebacterium guangdongense]|uniref:EmrB/QacA subfamily drug resistance transporter n=1 Tax=Corynebacterium guangdongense TaxID=1783348 RepID=A0ABU1ZVU6_9CORY|nr:DHA2 family efflux MFS transporter permease subunit [Corynebacterium guangdongense]MDR7329054.1 EmrB/QacA subfamily drug resistance transporter [Corynebacterium guangdongense]